MAELLNEKQFTSEKAAFLQAQKVGKIQAQKNPFHGNIHESTQS